MKHTPPAGVNRAIVRHTGQRQALQAAEKISTPAAKQPADIRRAVVGNVPVRGSRETTSTPSE